MNPDVIEMEKELASILGTATGAENVQMSFTIQYLVTAKDEDAKINLEKIAEMLIEQAEKSNLGLEITVATKEELEEAKSRYEAMVS